MNLDSLRLAALSSKRQRKLQEVEEGEIDSNSTTAPTPTTNDSPRLSPRPVEPPTTRHDSPSLPTQFATSPPPVHLFSPPPVPPTQVHAIKEESKGIIAQLISYGVTPDYLLSVGVSRDIIDISFHELGLAPPSFAPVAPAVNPKFRRGTAPDQPYGSSASLDYESYGVRHTSPPPAHLLPPPNPDLALIEARKREELFALVEARKREELLARMAANAARNKQKAMSLESELDSLFASASSAPPVKIESDEEEGELMDVDTVREAEVDSEANLGALRDSLAHTEEIVNVPATGPFGAEVERQTRAFGRRPVAVDFEAEPTISLPPTSTRSYVSDMPVKMVIDLSESESEEEEDEEGEGEGEGEKHSGGRSNGDAAGGVQDGVASAAGAGENGGKAPEGGQAVAMTGGADTEAKRKLEEKELEIKRIMDRIAKMEKKKGRSTPSRQSSVPVASTVASAPATATSTPQPSPPPVAASELEEAREHVQILEAQRTSLVAAVHEDEEMASLEADMDAEAEASLAQDSAIDLPPTVEAIEPLPSSAPAAAPRLGSAFTPYESSLARFPLCRPQPSPSSLPASSASPHAASVSSAASSSLDTSKTGVAGISTFVAHKRGVDASKRLCRAEASGGTCHETNCKSVHLASFLAPTEDDVAQFAAAAGASGISSRPSFL
ncbi:hypothetical protein BCR35DRAFT_303534 [Leucosporidium creatinivorum]|uniref:Zinc-finger domain-containing protein n=1 Tax=Leucosporidium creatinivorum TaxID=106004 RepID=A0A1Y2FG61_9BASI|nr:hypothetical protein BCR35DRAFT_303534 [Leucosporidium creatinivorum]